MYAVVMKPRKTIDTAVDEFVQAIVQLVRRIRAEGGSHELSWTESFVIARLAKDGPATTAELARAEEVVATLRRRRNALLGGERILSASGYADRLALVTGAALTACGPLSAAILLFYVTTIVIEIAVATRRGGSGRHGETLRVLAAAATVLAVDVIATAVATIGAAIGAHPSWRRSERRPEPIIITRRGKPVG